jgi:hypothetical protein
MPEKKNAGENPGVSFFGKDQIIPNRTAPKNMNTAQIARALKLRAVSKVCLPCG